MAKEVTNKEIAQTDLTVALHDLDQDQVLIQAEAHQGAEEEMVEKDTTESQVPTAKERESIEIADLIAEVLLQRASQHQVREEERAEAEAIIIAKAKVHLKIKRVLAETNLQEDNQDQNQGIIKSRRRSQMEMEIDHTLHRLMEMPSCIQKIKLLL